MAGEAETFSVPMEISVNINKLRGLVRNYVNKHQYESALFWADKVASLSKDSTPDLYTLAQALYLTGQYHRATFLIKKHKLDAKYLSCRYLAAKCYYECKEFQESLDMLDQIDSKVASTGKKRAEEVIPDVISDETATHTNITSCINLLRGRVLEAMDNRTLAQECFREALREDVFCYEAFDLLVNHHMLTAQEERELLDSLPFSTQCLEEEIELLKCLYENKIKKYNKPKEVLLPTNLTVLQNNIDVLVGVAERHYYNCEFRESYKLSTSVLKKDPYCEQCLPLHVALLVELQKSNELFYLAHKLVDLYPNKAVSWFAVGCYYLLVCKNDPARRYLSKATSLDRVYGPAWLAFGHSFAAENEHDQAMAAYFTASHLMKGCHLPVLYIGLEYGLTNNAKLAERFFTQALSIAPEDPFVLHEMGVIAFQNQDHLTAERFFKSALNKVQIVCEEVISEKWEPLLNNLGHVCRKLKKYDDALTYHQQALVLSPRNPSTLSAIGYIHALTGCSFGAVDYFHKALGMRRDDTFSTTMLSNAIEHMMLDGVPCEGVPDELPPYRYEGKLEQSVSKRSDLNETANTETSSMMMDMEGSD